MKTDPSQRDLAIIDVAKRMLGCADAAVTWYVTYNVDVGEWFGLAVKWTPNGEWEQLGRRQTHQELVGLIRFTAAKRGTMERN
jgi:hypothetical protein